MSERIVMECTLVLDEPAHLGGADPDATSDRPLLRNADGRIYLAGTALKGVLRARSSLEALFGSTTRQARLLVDDAPLVDTVATQVRDGVAISPELGIAEHSRKYDFEVLPAGARFSARFEAVVDLEPQRFLRELCAALEVLSSGVEIGARTRRGFGRLRRDGPWRVRRHAGAPGLRAWLFDGCSGAPPSWQTGDTQHDDLATLLGVASVHLQSRSETTIRLDLKVDGSLLIRAPVAGSGPADHAQLHAQWADGSLHPVITGTSLAGVFRSRCTRIARTLLEGAGNELIDGLFGPRTIRDGNTRASRLRFNEAKICGSTTLRHTRVRIDPWTGGASDALLFTSEPTYGGQVTPEIRWSRPTDERRERAERALLLLALRDLVLGDLHVGGESAAGRGRLAPLHADGRFGYFGDQELRLTSTGGLAGDFRDDLHALQEWGHD